jgi:hypothetical protein
MLQTEHVRHHVGRRLGNRRPNAGSRRQVEDDPGPNVVEYGRHHTVVGDVGLDQPESVLSRRSAEVPLLGRAGIVWIERVDGSHPPSLAEQPVDQGAPDESGAARDQRGGDVRRT